MATDLRVGGRLEAVAPRRVTDTGDRARLAGLVALAVLVHGWVVANAVVNGGVTARDAIEFARIALQLEHPQAAGLPDVVAVLKQSKQPPGYPLAVLAASLAVREVYPAPLPNQMLLAAQLASAAAGVLLVFPTYWLARGLFGKAAGVSAAVLVQVLPVFALVTSDGLTEGLYLLMVATALMLGVRAVRKPGIGGFLLCGMAVGGAYLVRPEGLAAAAAVGGVVVGLVLRREWPTGPAAGRLTALTVGVFIVAAPYMTLIGGLTNKPSDPIPKILKSIREVGEAAPAGGGPALFAAWWDPARDGTLTLWVPRAIAKETLKAFHYMPAGLAAIGLIAAGRRLRFDPGVWVLLGFAGLTVFVLVLLAALGQSNPAGKFHYVSERHTLPLVFVGCVFAAAGLEWVAGRAGWAARAGVLVLVAVSCVGPLLKPLHYTKAGHVEAGKYLAGVLAPADVLIDPFELAQFYAGRTVRAIPPDPDPARVVYAVDEPTDKDDAPHSALPRRVFAKGVVNDGRAVRVFAWPADALPDKVRVAVYKLERGPDGK